MALPREDVIPHGMANQHLPLKNPLAPTMTLDFTPLWDIVEEGLAYWWIMSSKGWRLGWIPGRNAVQLDLSKIESGLYYSGVRARVGSRIVWDQPNSVHPDVIPNRVDRCRFSCSWSARLGIDLRPSRIPDELHAVMHHEYAKYTMKEIKCNGPVE